MVKIVVIVFFILGASLLFFTQKIILIKKSVYYKYIDKTKKLSNFDYLMDYDGNWLYKKIDFDSLYLKNNDKHLLETKRKIKRMEIISVSILILLLLFTIIVKFFKIFQ